MKVHFNITHIIYIKLKMFLLFFFFDKKRVSFVIAYLSLTRLYTKNHMNTSSIVVVEGSLCKELEKFISRPNFVK